MFATGRISGVLLPIFSLRSSQDFGIGDFGCTEGFFRWMKEARQRMWMLLPLLPTAPGDPSPYATRSAFGLNPLFIDLHQLPEFNDAGGLNALSAAEVNQLAEARAAPRIRYDLVFSLKNAALRRAFDRFYETEWKQQGERARRFGKFRTRMADWLDAYSLFAAISDEQGQKGWWDWPQPLRQREPAALEEVRARLEREVLFHAWQQWVAEEQWHHVRELARAQGVLICGDEPFIIGQNSADAWSHPQLLRRDARLGVPPDAFSADGQDWGLPYFDFQAIAQEDFAWLKFRARMAADYFDLRRIDHAVGYFRQWIRDQRTPKGRFIPPDEASHRALGEQVFRLLSEEESGIIAEDLGVIPPFVREILSRLQIPGYKVMRWERDDGVYRNPHQYPKVSLATTGTHDTDTLREYWETAPEEDRLGVGKVYPEFAGLAPGKEFTPEIHRALLAAAENAASDLCVLPWQDVLGTMDRINLPGSIGDANWSYRIAQRTEELLQEPQTRRAASFLAELTDAARR